MTQREYISASLKIAGLAVLLYGAVQLPLNLLRSGYSLFLSTLRVSIDSRQGLIVYGDGAITERMGPGSPDDIRFVRRRDQQTALKYLSRVPVSIAVILFGRALIRRDDWFTDFLVGRGNTRPPAPGEPDGTHP